MHGAAAALPSLWRRGFRRLPSLRHRDATIAQRLIDAAGAEPERLLKQLGTTSEGLTTDIDHSHHPHRKDSVYAEPREQLGNHNDNSDGERRRTASLFSVGLDARLCPVAGPLLASGPPDHPRLLRAGASGQDLVRAALGNVIDAVRHT